MEYWMSEGLEQRLKEAKKRKWTDRIGIAVSGLAAGILIYAVSMSVQPVERKTETGATEKVNNFNDYFTRRLPKKAEKYKRAVSEYLGSDYIGFK
jgi:hypothetical protein